MYYVWLRRALEAKEAFIPAWNPMVSTQGFREGNVVVEFGALNVVTDCSKKI